MKITPVILAAGEGTRMRSSRPKVLHPILGKPMVRYSLEACREATGERPILVVGYKADQIQEEIGDKPRYVHQHEQLGTGHAVSQVEPLLRGQTDYVLVTYGDMPLITSDTLAKLGEAQISHEGPISLLTLVAENPRGFGRIVRDADSQVQAIVEEAIATPEQLAIKELNTGVFCFSADWLWDALAELEITPEKGEYYLTDLVEMAVSKGQSVQAIQVENPGR